MLDDAAELRGRGEQVAVAMVVDTRRSAPRPLGSRLFVTESGEMRGSVSGGCVESDVVLRYVPRSVLAGAVISLLLFAGTIAFACIVRRRHNEHRAAAQTSGGRA